MKIVIVEDERPTAELLMKYLGDINSDFVIEKVLTSVKDSVQYLANNTEPDLLFLDIQLTDGLSFDIFNFVKLSCPIIFTTAYQEYAVKASKLNSIDYLLKPVDKGELESAVQKFQNNFKSTENESSANDNFEARVALVLQKLTKRYKERFLVKVGVHIKTFTCDEILCFYSLERSSYMLTSQGKSYDIN
jgi:two-component system response regulator LytT